MDVRVRLGLNLQNIRRDQGLSQEELAARSSIHQSYLSDIERGRRNPSLLVLDRIAKALNVEIEDLVRKRTAKA